MTTSILLTGFGGALVVITIALCYAYWPSWSYSWKHAKHIIDVTQTETEVAPEYGWVTRNERNRSHEPFADDYRDWRTQTFDDLSPEALEREA